MFYHNENVIDASPENLERIALSSSRSKPPRRFRTAWEGCEDSYYSNVAASDKAKKTRDIGAVAGALVYGAGAAAKLMGHEILFREEATQVAELVVAVNIPNFVRWEHDKYKSKLRDALFSAAVVAEEADVRGINSPEWATSALNEASTTWQEVVSPKPN